MSNPPIQSDDKPEQEAKQSSDLDQAVPTVQSEDSDPEQADYFNEDYVDSIRAVVMGEVLDQVPKDLFIPPDALQVVLETFEGPLDLLLYLIRKQNLDIVNIQVAVITEQYMKYVDLMRKANLDLAAEYLLMAAMLAEIKSRVLLPKPKLLEEEEEDPRMALIKQLQQYERFREAANSLEDRPRVERDVFIANAHRDDPSPPKREPSVSLLQLTRAFQGVLERAHVNQLHQVTKEVMSMRERMTDILKSLQDTGKDFLAIEDGFGGDIYCAIRTIERRYVGCCAKRSIFTNTC